MRGAHGQVVALMPGERGERGLELDVLLQVGNAQRFQTAENNGR